jgi:hypothetical protein
LQRDCSFPLKKYLADQGSFESGFLRLDDSARKDPFLGQSQKGVIVIDRSCMCKMNGESVDRAGHGMGVAGMPFFGPAPHPCGL